MSTLEYLLANPGFVFFLSASIVFLVLWLTATGKTNTVIARRVMSTDYAGQPWGMATSCIDLRFQDEMQDYFEKLFGNNKFDNFVIPGPGLALIGTNSFFNTFDDQRAQSPGGFASSNYMQAFASTMVLARTIHTISSIVIMDHEDCGYYADYFNGTTSGRSMSALINGNTTITYNTSTSYTSLNADQQFGVAAYYMEQAKSLWGRYLFYSATNVTTSHIHTVSSISNNAPSLTGVQMYSFFIYKNGFISQTLNPYTITNGT
jgi:hypothetical protein